MISGMLKVVPVALLVLSKCVFSFHIAPPSTERSVLARTYAVTSRHANECTPPPNPDRRSFVTFLGSFLSSIAVVEPAFAGIDVSGLKQDQPGGPSVIASQLKSYDGSGATRAQEIRASQSSSSSPGAAVQTPADSAADVGSAATYAFRSGGLPTTRSLGIGLLQRYEGYVAAPPGSNLRQIPISFDFPSDWLQLDKLGGGIVYVDQRNGDKLYVLRAPLPEGTTLDSVPKSFFADSIFDPRSDFVRGGTVVESGRASRAQMIQDCDGGKVCAPRRRILLKYDTITGSGVQTVERRGLVDAYEVGGYAFMLMTSSNAVKFDKKGRERDTVEAIVDSFRLGL